MTRKENEFVDEMDVAFPNGKFVEPSDAPLRIRLRDLDGYCQQVGKNPTELTEEEMKPFRY